MVVVVILIAVQLVATAVAVVDWSAPRRRRERYLGRLGTFDPHHVGHASNRSSELRAALDHVVLPTNATAPVPDLPPVSVGVGLRDVLDTLSRPAPDQEPTEE
ncbi:MAG: hypothetical protein RLZZ01_1185 [Actinomycetota bacterium]